MIDLGLNPQTTGITTVQNYLRRKGRVNELVEEYSEDNGGEWWEEDG